MDGRDFFYSKLHGTLLRVERIEKKSVMLHLFYSISLT